MMMYTRGILVFHKRLLVKAGSYGIQSGGGKFVKKIEGDYDTVVGLSVTLTKKLINEATND